MARKRLPPTPPLDQKLSRIRPPNAGPRIERISLASTPLVSLTVPGEVPEHKGAFVWLRPPADTPSDVVEAWRTKVATRSLAVRVFPTPKSATVAKSIETLSPKENIREEVLALAAEAHCPSRPALVSLLEVVMTGAGL